MARVASQPQVRRSIGRPRQVAGVDARELLLDAALTLFAERGIAGTTVAQIAARVGVTPAMVHYYFSNRDRLLDAVAEERLSPTVTSVWSPVVATQEVVPMLRGLVQRILKATEANPWLPSLWLREIVSEGGQLRERLFKVMRFEYVRHLIGAVASAQRRGEIIAELEPRLVLVSVIGLTLLPLATIRMWQSLPVMQGVGREDIARHAEALLVSAFSKPPRRRAKSA
jgi:AcrR family transcriptional regulator